MNHYRTPDIPGQTFTAEEISAMTLGQCGSAAVRQKIRNNARVAGHAWETVNAPVNYPAEVRESAFTSTLRKVEPRDYSPYVSAWESDAMPINPLAFIDGNPFSHVFKREVRIFMPYVGEDFKEQYLARWGPLEDQLYDQRYSEHDTANPIQL